MKTLKRKQRTAALLLCALLLLALCACGEDDPNAGVYLCTGLRYGDQSFLPGEVYNGDVRLELRNGGRGRLTVGEHEGTLRWLLEGERLSIDMNGLLSPGTLRDGEITLDLLDNGVVYTFVREELVPALPTPTPQPASFAELAGDYYGRWEIENSAGAMPETWYDCCAEAALSENGLTLTLWDEQGSRKAPMAVLVFGDESLAASDGWFWLDDAEGIAASWDGGSLTLSGRHNAGGEAFDFTVHLRPWGASWEDTEEQPYSYRFWYLPLIEAGEEMPDQIQTMLER